MRTTCLALFAAAQALPASPVMDALRLAGESLRPRLSEFSRGGTRPIYGAFLSHLHDQLHAFWDSVPAPARAAAEAASMRPLGDTPSPMPGPYWRWVPIVQGWAAPAPAAPLTFSSPCFSVNTARGVFSPDGATYTVTLSSSAPVNATCSDSYLLGTVDYLHVATHAAGAAGAGAALNTTLDFPVNLARRASPLWTARNGALVLRFIDPDPLTIIYEALSTVGLFIPSLITSPISEADSASNYDFISRYANITMAPRSAGNVTVDESLFQSGDIIFIHRGDGLATLEQWATGATTSHTVTLLRGEVDNQLWVVESQSNGADWPIDRIQKNKWADWQEMAATASYGYVWLPVAATARQLFNVTAAWEFFNATEGVNYGFQDFAATFYDTLYDNLPWPARPESLEVVIGVLEGLIGFVEAEGVPLLNLLFTQTMVQRLGGPAVIPFNASFVEALEEAASQGQTFASMLAAPEQDGLQYQQATGTHAGGAGPALVCNAYACALHKAAGSFGAIADQINCADTHNADVYQMTVFDGAPARPAACVAADPENPHCQLAGRHSIILRKAGTTVPYREWIRGPPPPQAATRLTPLPSAPPPNPPTHIPRSAHGRALPVAAARVCAPRGLLKRRQRRKSAGAQLHCKGGQSTHVFCKGGVSEIRKRPPLPTSQKRAQSHTRARAHWQVLWHY